jgi:hypothetical protein
MAKPGDTKTKGKTLYRMSSSGKWFKSSNSPKANQQRALNTRLAQPIANIPGTNLTSGLTERDLAHEAGAATTVKYAPSEQAIAEQLAQAVQQKTDTNVWYEDYKNRLQSYQQQVGAYQQGANDAMQHLQQGVTGLGQQDQSYVQQQQAGMPQGTAPVGASVGQNANAALAVRQGIAGNFGVNQANTGAANNTYASNLANVVGPQQQLTALATKQGGINKVLKQKTALKGEEGAYNQEYRSNRRNDETKNLLAAGALGVNMSNAQTSASKAQATAQNQTASLRQRTKAETDRHNVAVANATTSADRLAETQRHNQAMEELSAKKGAEKKTKGKTLTPQQVNTGLTQLPNLKEYLSRARSGKAFVEGHPKQSVLGRHGAVTKVRNSTKKLTSDALLGAAADAVYNQPPHISPVTARRLKEAGFDPARVARELGVPLGRGGSNIPLNKK